MHSSVHEQNFIAHCQQILHQHEKHTGLVGKDPPQPAEIPSQVITGDGSRSKATLVIGSPKADVNTRNEQGKNQTFRQS